MNPLKQLHEYGQSVWVDYIRRHMLTEGDLRGMMEQDGVSGVTSNPTIFEKALESNDYDHQIRELLEIDSGMEPAALYDALSVEDLRMAADVLRPVYDRTQGADGYVSIEVSPYLASNTSESMSEARRLWREVNRRNVMVKIPGTKEGIPAIESLLAEGININITLMFSMAHYEAVAQAFLRGISRCGCPQNVASVASIFVSRIDTAVDRELELIGTPEALALHGKIGISNSKLIYKRFGELFYGEPFADLRNKGVRVQKVLWASTGTKNPAYSDVLYVDELIGADTINTMPLKTLEAFRKHGAAQAATILEEVGKAEANLDKLRKLGVDLNAVTEKLQQEGVKSFRSSLDKLLEALDRKHHAIHT